MRRLALPLLVLLAFGAGFYKLVLRPEMSPFQVASQFAAGSEAARLQSDFVSLRLHTQTHASSLVELKDGRIRAFWFAGSREGARDVEIRSAIFDPAQRGWSAERSVTDRLRTQQGLRRYVAKLGNPVASRAADGSLWLYYVTVSLGGWAGSSITAMRSVDDGETWSTPRRLITSPFLNISTLVRNAPVPYADGTFAFPVYHEFVSKFGELLRLDEHGEVLDKQRLAPGGKGTLQPVLLVQSSEKARVLMRYSGPPPHRVVSVVTQDGGHTWSAPKKLGLPNPDAAVSALVLPDGRLLAVLNNIEAGRDELALMISADGGENWQTVRQLEDLRNLPRDETHYSARVAEMLRQTDARVDRASAAERKEILASVVQQACTSHACRDEYSYPFLLQAHNGDFHVVYTWNRVFIKHVRFTPGWLKKQLERTK